MEPRGQDWSRGTRQYCHYGAPAVANLRRSEDEERERAEEPKGREYEAHETNAKPMRAHNLDSIQI